MKTENRMKKNTAQSDTAISYIDHKYLLIIYLIVMELSSICELSSALRGDDLEKSELVRKKITLELAIKQQEGRVCNYASLYCS